MMWGSEKTFNAGKLKSQTVLSFWLALFTAEGSISQISEKSKKYIEKLNEATNIALLISF